MSKFNQISNQTKKLFDNYESSHNWEHTERVYKLCLHIGKKEKANMKILKLSAILHDIGLTRGNTVATRRHNHAERGAKIAKKILKQYNYSQEAISKIQHAIECHRFRNNKIPKTLEAKILYDSDKLDAIGAIGIGRAFMFAADVGARVHNKNIENIEKTKPFGKEDTAWREYSVKLKNIKNKMLTKEGKSLAKKRHQFMKKFFERLNKEVEGKI